MDTNTAQNTVTAQTLPNLPVQGEHPLLDIPFVVGIDGRQFKGERLSLVAAEITGLMDPALDGATRLMRFMFPFKGFSVTLEVLGQVQSLDRGNGHATVTFVDPAAEHLPQLRHLINSYIAGDLVALGEVIGVAPSIPSPANRAAATSGNGLTFRRALGSAGLALATLALVAAVGTLAYNRIFTRPLAAPGLAVQDGMTLTATASGQVDYVNLAAVKGEVAFTIRATSGEMLSIAMPCDCTATALAASVGATVTAGEPMLNVHAADAPMVITATVPAADVLTLAFADHVSAQFGDGSTINAAVDSASLRADATAAGLSVRLIPTTPLSADQSGQLAKLTIIKKSWF
jgi:hypothetical protein